MEHLNTGKDRYLLTPEFPIFQKFLKEHGNTSMPIGKEQNGYKSFFCFFAFSGFNFAANEVYYSCSFTRAKRARKAEGEGRKFSSGLRMRADAFIQDEEGGSAMRRNDDGKS